MAETYRRTLPSDTIRRTTACQYCAVGCGYNALLIPVAPHPGTAEHDGLSRFITPAMRSDAPIRFRGGRYRSAVAPDARCDLNRGNHSVRGGSQGGNLNAAPQNQSTRDRLVAPQIRSADGTLVEVEWRVALEVVARLVERVTGMRRQGDVVRPDTPERLGVKLYEYQYLENTYAATKLFYRAIGTPNVAYHDRPSTAGSSPGMKDAGIRPHAFAYDDVRDADVIVIWGGNPYENQSVFFMHNCVGKEIIVVDPRRTATADYAAKTGGLHVQPTRLGVDSRVIFALCRHLIETNGGRNGFPLHPGIEARPRVPEADKARMRTSPLGHRRASRVLSFPEFCDFLGVGNPAETTYTREAAATAAFGDAAAKSTLEDLARRIAPSRGKKVCVLYEKGLIWGFNYHNTAAIAALGLLTWRSGMSAPLVGRMGGHQKGWAEASEAADGFASTGDIKYPFGNASDLYRDSRLSTPNLVHHNLDVHVFGPDPIMEPTPVPDSPGRVRLRNGVETGADPDVALLWIIGGNYLGQTNDAARKRAVLASRRGQSWPDLRESTLPEEREPRIEAIVQRTVDALGPSLDAGRLVTIHQDIYANPTTALADIVLPAAGWGEDDFCRYNAERRLRLYERFQDPPLHPDDAGRLGPRDPAAAMGNLNVYRFSPLPDWRIFAWVGRRLANRAGGATTGFDWSSSAELADEMAAQSNRTRGFIGPILEYGRAQEPPAGLHAVLGAGGGGDAPLLDDRYGVDGEGAVYGNQVASNGAMLPTRTVDLADGRTGLRGSMRQSMAGTAYFVWADWSEIAPFADEFTPQDAEVFLTCGRVNHLWNTMFNHRRNRHALKRYPADMRGTVLEVNPDWARANGLGNGAVVRVTSRSYRDEPAASFVGVISYQDSLPDGGAFAMFSYPVRDDVGDIWDGYVNNATYGYWDGINPIGALKYARATLTALGGVESRLPTALRNRIGPPEFDPRGTGSPAWDDQRRVDWQMKEVVVTRGLPRAVLRRPFRFTIRAHGTETHSYGRFWREVHGLTPRAFYDLEIAGEQVGTELLNRLTSDMPAGMLAPESQGYTIDWTARVNKARTVIERIPGGGVTPGEMEEHVYALLDDLIDLPHRAVERWLFSPEDFLDQLLTNPAVHTRFVRRLAPGDRNMRWTLGGRLIDEWHPTDLAVVRRFKP